MRDQNLSDALSQPVPDDGMIDVATVLAGCGGDRTLFEKMAQSFLLHAEARVADLREAVQRRESLEIQRTSHKLKGLVSAFSPKVADAVDVMEQLNTTGEADRLLDQFTTIADMIGAICSQLPTLSLNGLKTQIK